MKLNTVRYAKRKTGFTLFPMRKTLQFCIKSKIENIYTVEQQIIDLTTNVGFNQDSLFSLRLAMDESLINAIIHGNQNEESKEVHIKATLSDSHIEITVRDEGNGFDRNQLVDPRKDPYLQRTNGRGVFLIQQFTNGVRFNDKGNEITFRINRDLTLTAIDP